MSTEEINQDKESSMRCRIETEASKVVLKNGLPESFTAEHPECSVGGLKDSAKCLESIGRESGIAERLARQLRWAIERLQDEISFASDVKELGDSKLRFLKRRE